jgi:hypothetical protein
MPASQHLRTLSVRLPESEIRRIKSLAATRGVTVQEAVHQALDSWAADLRPSSPEALESLEGSLAGVNIAKLMREEKKNERRKEQRW